MELVITFFVDDGEDEDGGMTALLCLSQDLHDVHFVRKANRAFKTRTIEPLTPPVLEQTKQDAELRIDKWIRDGNVFEFPDGLLLSCS